MSEASGPMAGEITAADITRMRDRSLRKMDFDIRVMRIGLIFAEYDYVPQWKRSTSAEELYVEDLLKVAGDEGDRRKAALVAEALNG